MGTNTMTINLIELENIVDAEFEKTKTAGKFNLLTNTLVDRVEGVSAEQQELKSLLQALGVQIKNVEKTLAKSNRNNDVEKMIGGGKDMPIVIDDEEEISKQAVEHVADHVITKEDTSTSVTEPERTKETTSQPETLESNARRRPLILEQTPKMQENSNDVPFTQDSGPSMVSREAPWLESSKSASDEVVPSRLSPTMPAVCADSDISTDTASSPVTEPSQSSITEEFQSEVFDKEENKEEASDLADNLEKELEKKIQAPESKKLEIASSSARPHSPSNFKTGSRVLGKRSSDIWFPGEVVKTMTDKNGQVKYHIKYDKGQKGVLSSNHICPEEPAALWDLSVGSRVVGLYGNLSIWYAGIVAEMACPGNRNRVLVFFDDGFAQYLPLKKVHKVHHKGQNVWEDVIEDSRDFIQEYLEEYPSRPMLHVRVGQWIKTEWKGQWLKARVTHVDGSLVKMLFQIDNRSEWIYRGSTRLDPLYTALVIGERTRSTKARSRKLTRNTSSKDTAPYIEYNITKRCYGVSPYSKTDPKGIQQMQLEEQRLLTQQQHEASKHPKQPSKVSQPKQEEKPAPKFEEKPVQRQIIQQPPPFVKETKPSSALSTELEKKEVVILDDEPVIESTYSCIQASTMRKKTGASLVNNVIFKAVNHQDEQPYPILPDIKPSPSTQPTSLPTQIQTEFVVDQYKPKYKPDAQWKAPWLNLQRNKQRQGSSDNVIKPHSTASSQKPYDAASILKDKLEAKMKEKLEETIVNAEETMMTSSSNISQSVPHTCSFACSRSSSRVSIDPLRHNPLALPILMDWKREIVKRRGKTNKRDVYYRTPCNRRLRTMAEVIEYLQLTGESSLNVDHFTFDWRVHTDNIIPPVPVVNDISNGQENRPLPAVNEVDGTRPPNIQYMSMRQFAPEVELTTDPGFMVCCDCKDNCSNPSKCTCIQLTLDGCKAMDMKDISKMTYHYRKLKDCVQTGIYECNSECSCSKNCLNRVVQNGIQLRLEVFKTENRGWGLRATDDIPAGTFVCTYAGYILNEELANQDGRKYGDEYMAELDYIEVAEKAKEGYESDVSDLEEDDNVIDDMLQSDDNFSYSGNSAPGSSDDDVDYNYENDGQEEADIDEDDFEHGHSSDDYSNSSIRDGINKDKNLQMQRKKKRQFVSEESIVAERESKANVLSRLGTPMMCVLALKRNDNDLKKSYQFLKQYTSGGQTSSVNYCEDICKIMNGKAIQLVEKSNTNIVQCDSGISVSGGESVCSSQVMQENELTVKDNEQGTLEDKMVVETTSKSKVEKEEETGTAKTGTDTEFEQNKTNFNDGTADPTDDVPQLLSADDLQRLAASQPKSLQPPVLTRRGTVLDETIEKLKKRVVNPELSVLELEDITSNTQSGSGEIENESCQTSNASDKKSSCNGDKDDDNEQSETSSLSRNSSSLSQSASSRSSSPAVDTLTKQNDKKTREGKRLSEKEKMSIHGQNSNTRYLKTRTLFGEEHCYVIDATFGNCGRFLNHSCSPNLFVQNVFVDTHDMRFPWVAFYAQNNIKAGSELTWDYMYEVGSVRDKSLYCLCGSSGCRGRLL